MARHEPPLQLPARAMPACHSALLLSRIILLSLFTLLLHLTTHLPSCHADVAIPYRVLGPSPTSLGGMYALRAYYNHSAVPWNSSNPTINVGLSLSLLGTAKETGFVDFLAMLVDVCNMRGGVMVAGVPHYISLTYSVDDGSPHLTQLIYRDMFHSGNFSAFIAPQTDTLLQALLPMLPTSNATIVSTYNPDPADFSSGYKNLFGLLPPDDLIFRVSLTDINLQAQRYAASGGAGASQYGIKTVCMFTVNESLAQTRVQGVREWIAAENERRGNGSDSAIEVLVDMIWARTALDYSNYTAALAACPDNVDLMVLTASDSDGIDAALALRASQLRPKAVIGLLSGRTIDLDDPTQVTTAEGWVIPVEVLLEAASIYSVGGVFTDVYDVAYANAVWRAGAGLTNAAQNSYSYVYVTSFTVITAALTVTRSLQPADMRAAVLSLNGQTTAFSRIEFDPDTGYNTLLVPLVAQMRSSGKIEEGNSSVVQYPYNWPWRLPADGDLLIVEQSVNSALIAVVISVLGAWVALIITEQSIYMKRTGSRYWPLWLFLVALSLGGVAMWCAQVMTSTALQTRLHGASEPLPMMYSFDVAMIALIPCIVLTFLGLFVLLGDVETPAGHRSSTAGIAAGGRTASLSVAVDTRAARSAELELMARKAEEKRRASLSASLHLLHLYHSITWRVLLGGGLVTIAMYQSRAAMFGMFVQSSSRTVSVYVWILVWLLDAFVIPLSCLWVVHAVRARSLGAFLFAGAVMGDWFVAMRGVTFQYRTSGTDLSAALQSANVGYTAVSLVSGVIAAGICFIFIGLQFSRMQLSRNGLSQLAASMQASIAKLQDKLKVSDETNAQLKQQLTAMCRMTAHTTLDTPIHTTYGYCMAQATTLDTYQSMWQYLSAANTLKQQSAPIATARVKATPSVSSESSPVQQPRTISEIAMSQKPPLRLPSLTLTPVRSASVAPMPPLPALRLRGSTTVVDDTERSSMHTPVESSRSMAVSDSPLPSALSVTPAVQHGATTSTGSATARPATAAAVVTKRRTSISGTSRGSATAEPSRTRRPGRGQRTYEENLSALLDAYSQQDLDGTPPAMLSPGGGQNKASISMPPPPAAAASATLAEILVHPACIAVIKAELQAIHSVENLVFYLHAQRYKQLTSNKLRKHIATAMYDTFIREGAEQQININARQRDGIGFCVTKRGDDSCSMYLFEEAQREVLQLMETNLLGSKAEKRCSVLMAHMPISELAGVPGAGAVVSEEAVDSADK